MLKNVVQPFEQYYESPLLKGIITKHWHVSQAFLANERGRRINKIRNSKRVEKWFSVRVE